MWPIVYKPSHRHCIFAVLVVGALLFLYPHDIQWLHDIPRLRFQLGGSQMYLRAFGDKGCEGRGVIAACAMQHSIKVLFVVDTVLENSQQRQLARNMYAKGNFARPINWLTVFNMVGNVTDPYDELKPEARSECSVFGDIVVLDEGRSNQELNLEKNGNTSSYLLFVPWILENCPHVDLVVFMKDNVMPHPFYLPHYRTIHMDHRPEVIHCHGIGEVPTSLCRAESVLMAKMPGLKLFSRKARVENDVLILYNVEAKDMASYVAVEDKRTMLYTVGAVIFYAFPQDLNVTMTSLWEEMMRTPENRPDYLLL